MEKALRNGAAAKQFPDTADHWTDPYIAHDKCSPAFHIRRNVVGSRFRKIALGGGCARAFDLGRGAGRYLPLLAALAREVVGIDIAPAMLDAARSNLPPEASQITITQGSVRGTRSG